MSFALKIGVICVVCALLLGCPLDRPSELQRTLGPYQYMGLDPQLAFSVQKAEFHEPEESFSPATLTYTVSVKQHAPNFPLTSYRLFADAVVLDSAGSKLDSFRINGIIEHGVLSVSDVEKFYGPLSKIERSRFPSLKIQVETYGWIPEVQYKPHVPKT